MIEVPAVRLVLAKATDAELEGLEAGVASIERAAARNDIAAFLREDRSFHLAMLSLSGNGRLVRLVGQLRDQTRLIGLRGMADSGMLAESAAEHRVILDALRARDARRAETLVRHHLEHTRGTWAGRVEAGSSAR
jgi:DNA-binding GntR family transcriptional regulator